jgi:segregation and condensation protein B
LTDTPPENERHPGHGEDAAPDAGPVATEDGAGSIASVEDEREAGQEADAAATAEGVGLTAPPECDAQADEDAASGVVPAAQIEDGSVGPASEESSRAAAVETEAAPGAAPEAISDPADTPAEAQAPPASREPDEAALRLAEAAIFASTSPMTPRGLSQILPADIDAAAVIDALRLRYEGRGIELVEIGGGLQFRTAADLAPVLRKVIQVPRRLPRVALETLVIVAYHQPITRPEIEELRGASLAESTMDLLLENDLIVSRGRKETPGRPTLWATTPKFLEYFGLRDIRELPRRDDLLLETPRPDQGEAIRSAEANEQEQREVSAGEDEATGDVDRNEVSDPSRM